MTELKEGIVLYHGSYCIVENPDLEKCAAYKDFGQGFYLTTSKEQAKSFAKLTAEKRRQQGFPTGTFAYISFFKVTDINDLKTFVYFLILDFLLEALINILELNLPLSIHLLVFQHHVLEF